MDGIDADCWALAERRSFYSISEPCRVIGRQARSFIRSMRFCCSGLLAALAGAEPFVAPSIAPSSAGISVVAPPKRFRSDPRTKLCYFLAQFAAAGSFALMKAAARARAVNARDVALASRRRKNTSFPRRAALPRATAINRPSRGREIVGKRRMGWIGAHVRDASDSTSTTRSTDVQADAGI